MKGIQRQHKGFWLLLLLICTLFSSTKADVAASRLEKYHGLQKKLRIDELEDILVKTANNTNHCAGCITLFFGSVSTLEVALTGKRTYCNRLFSICFKHFISSSLFSKIRTQIKFGSRRSQNLLRFLQIF
jgi:hypothetical protein